MDVEKGVADHPKVFLVEDDAAFRAMVRVVLPDSLCVEEFDTGRAALAQANSAQDATRLRATQANHMSGFEDQMGVDADIKYRQPSTLSANGNTVESHREHAEFMDNALKYQASLNLLDSRIKGLRAAIKGE